MKNYKRKTKKELTIDITSYQSKYYFTFDEKQDINFYLESLNIDELHAIILHFNDENSLKIYLNSASENYKKYFSK